MDNENKWEYDYSSEHSQTGETGYPNVGSSGMNTANTAGTYGEAAQADPQLRWCWPQPWALSAALWEPRWATQAARWSSSRWHLPPRPAVIPALPPQ